MRPQTKLNAYLDAGAAGASGTVYEPFAVANKFPTARLHVHYARGCTLAESFYLSVKWPFQLLIVGDPLCSPYGDFPQFDITGVEDGSTVTEDFTLKVEQPTDTAKIKHFEVFYDDVYRETIETNEISISTDSMSDGYHEVHIVGVSDSRVAKKTSKKFGFFVQRVGHTVSIEIENPQCSIAGVLKVKVASSGKQKVQILQNSRVVATASSNTSFLIPASQLGLGSTKLQAVAKFPNGQLVKSSPVSVLLEPSIKGRRGKPLNAPSNQDLKTAVSSIREHFKNQYADTSPEGRKSLLSTLKRTADNSIDAPVYRFALLSESVKTATDLVAIDEGWTVCDQLQTSYDVKPIPQIEFLKNIAPTLDQPSAISLYLRGSEKIYQLIAEDRFDDAEDLSEALGSSVEELLPAASEDLDQLATKAKLLKRAFKKIEGDLISLEIDPLNEVANRTVGMFYCEEKLDFNRGLPYLAKSSSRKIRELAQLEMKLNNPSTKQRLAIADRWWDLGTDKKLDSFKILAAHHYQQIVNDLNGPSKITAQSRIKEASPPSSVSIAQLLSDNAWQVKWNNGATWPKIWMKNNRIFLSVGSGRPEVSYDFQEIDGVAEMSDDNRGAYYQIRNVDGTLLEFIGFTGRNGVGTDKRCRLHNRQVMITLNGSRRANSNDLPKET